MLKRALVGVPQALRHRPLPCGFSASISTIRPVQALDNSSGSEGLASVIHMKTLEEKSDKVELYKEWAGSYDADVEGEGYTAPRVLAAMAIEALSRLDLLDGAVTRKVLDAGCGTGLLGEILMMNSRPGAIEVHGCDISPHMMELAKSRGYAECIVADMNLPLSAFSDDSFDGVTCAGTFTLGHVRPAPALSELVRVVRPGGKVILSARSDYYESMGFDAVIVELNSVFPGLVVSSEDFQYLKGVVGKLVVLQKPF